MDLWPVVLAVEKLQQVWAKHDPNSYQRRLGVPSGVPFPKSSPSFFHLEELYFKIRELCVLDPGETHRGIDFPCFLQLMLPDKIHSLGLPEENGSLDGTSGIQVKDFFFLEIFSVKESLLQIGKDPCLLNVMSRYQHHLWKVCFRSSTFFF